MATNYDATIIQTFADRLYKQADQIPYSYGLVGFLFGAIGGWAMAASARADNPVVPVLICGIILCVLFLQAGRARAFALRLQAQTALCQAQIERNTNGR